jgi:hypothetical protein
MGKDFIMSIYKGTQLISGVATPIEPTKCIGQIVYAILPLVDAGLHLLDGSLINGNGIYSTFVTYISLLASTYPDSFVTEEEFKESIMNYGVCGKFVYNATNNTVRLPKITGFIEGTLMSSALGDLVEAGLPNIKGTLNFAGGGGANIATGVFKGDLSASTHTHSNTVIGANGATFDASESNPIYGNSDTVQPQAIKGYMYIVIATGTKTQVEIDVDNVSVELNNKIDKNELAEIQCVIETFQEGTSWYRIYSDGWCEQGGTTIFSDDWTLTFLKPFRDSNYYLFGELWDGDSTGNLGIRSQTPTSAVGNHAHNANKKGTWQASGYIW